MKRLPPLTREQVIAAADRALGITPRPAVVDEPFTTDVVTAPKPKGRKGKKPKTRPKSTTPPVEVITALVKATMLGRPTDYTPELGERICELLASGAMMTTICEMEGMPDRVTVWRWRRKHEEFRNTYAQARDDQMEVLLEEIVEISDNSGLDTVVDDEGVVQVDGEAIARSKLRVDTRKWVMEQLARARYGNKVDVNHEGLPAGASLFTVNIMLAPGTPAPVERPIKTIEG